MTPERAEMIEWAWLVRQAESTDHDERAMGLHDLMVKINDTDRLWLGRLVVAALTAHVEAVVARW